MALVIRTWLNSDLITNVDGRTDVGAAESRDLLISLGEESSAHIFVNSTRMRFRDLDAKWRGSAITSSEHSEAVLEEFYEMAVAHDYVVKGGIEYARKILMNAFGPETGEEDARPSDEDARQRCGQLSTRCRKRIRSSWRSSFTANIRRRSRWCCRT